MSNSGGRFAKITEAEKKSASSRMKHVISKSFFAQEGWEGTKGIMLFVRFRKNLVQSILEAKLATFEQVVTVTSDTNVYQAMRLMSDGRIVGMISMADVVRAVVDQQSGEVNKQKVIEDILLNIVDVSSYDELIELYHMENGQRSLWVGRWSTQRIIF
uniref:CBS domain-containing protein n=1 Tax=Tanacetum cinerariifolium TaxID=118510 RepID=A0A699IMY9_TANCI|nr:hypothetical protein [Tanacetum cinerariifolium]